MPEGHCEICQRRYYGWALVYMAHNFCETVGCMGRIVIEEKNNDLGVYPK
jgi:hypothetical protein